MRQDVMRRGVSGIKAFGILLLECDKTNSRNIKFEDFKSVLIECNISLTLEAITALFRSFDHENKGEINYDEFMFHLRVNIIDIYIYILLHTVI